MILQRYLAPQVHAVRRDADIVFLDVAADGYICLAQGAHLLRLEAGGAVGVARPDLADQLTAAGLLVPWPQAQRSPPPVLPQRSALRDTYGPLRFEDLAPIGRALVDARARYRQRPFGQILGAAARPSGAGLPRLTPELMSAVDCYHRWAPYAPLSGKCLLRSFLLLRALRREDLDALWVFGVRTWPFHAHCWLQVEDMVLDDHADRVGAYTPLMVV